MKIVLALSLKSIEIIQVERFNLALKCNEQSITIGGQPGNCEGDSNISYIGSMI